jgi:cyclopropane-fatty-acyl-phospholipid synthase
MRPNEAAQKAMTLFDDSMNIGLIFLNSVYDKSFLRMWRYYLLSCAGAFRSRRNHLWQIVFSKIEREGGCENIR